MKHFYTARWLRRISVTTVVFSSSLFLAAPSLSESPEELDRSAHTVYGLVMSPFCPGRLLADCPSEQASLLKKEIRSALEGGQSAEMIVDSLEKKYGPTTRAMPKVSGIGTWAWITPPLFAGFLLLLGIRWRSRRNAPITSDL
jgi:cytochrome c-type biogenesis protein CcmH/NrfF